MSGSGKFKHCVQNKCTSAGERCAHYADNPPGTYVPSKAKPIKCHGKGGALVGGLPVGGLNVGGCPGCNGHCSGYYQGGLKNYSYEDLAERPFFVAPPPKPRSEYRGTVANRNNPWVLFLRAFKFYNASRGVKLPADQYVQAASEVYKDMSAEDLEEFLETWLG